MATGQLVGTRRPPLRLGGTPVFLYHGMTDRPNRRLPRGDRKYWVSAADFRKHLSCIRNKGFRVASLHDVWSPPEAVNQRNFCAVLTFDDGRWSDYDIAFPRLLHAGVRADFFLNTANIDKRGFLSWQQVAEMQSAGMSFQSHSHNHVDLSRLPARELELQLKGSKQILEDRLGRSVDFLAAPYGLLNHRVVERAIQVGYRSVCSSFSWPARREAQAVTRVAVYAHTSLAEFQRLLLGNPIPYAIRTARSALWQLPKRLWLIFRQPRFGVTVVEEQA
jgi:peptidoglycan/xylan/chitin deacetylase (PgdA/CDA1 family)